MKDLIFETLLAEAGFRIAEKTITGIDVDEAIHEVASEMELNEDEIGELRTRAKKAPSVKKLSTLVVEDEDNAEEDEGEGDEIETAEPELEGNTIIFHGDDLDAALGVLMYKGIAWNSKDDYSVTFSSGDDVKKAQEALNRRWDFIDSNLRPVANIQFDNLEDYAKVLEFMSSKKMLVITNAGGPELDEDLDLELAESEIKHKKATKDAKLSGLPVPELEAPQMSYSALRKDRDVDPGKMDPVGEPRNRNLIVAKRRK